MRVRLRKAPSEPEVLLRFRFAQTVDFLPGNNDEPRRVPVDPPRVVMLEQRVDMRDLRGRIGTRTRAELLLQRTEGFRAGVWSLGIEHEEKPIGAIQQVTLEGINEPNARPDAGAPDGSA